MKALIFDKSTKKVTLENVEKPKISNSDDVLGMIIALTYQSRNLGRKKESGELGSS